MKKILSLLLVGVMVFSMIPAAYATNVYENPDENTQMGTDVAYTGSRTTIEDDGSATHDVEYTITVPAKLAPKGSGTVTLEGMWPSDATVKVTADPSVEMVNSINSGDKKTLAVTFAGITLAGNNTAAVSDDETVSVADIEAALFGTWNGKFNYNVDYTDGTDSGSSGGSSGDTDVSTVGGAATFSDGVSLSWDELKLEENGAKYDYGASSITDNETGNGTFRQCSNLTSIRIPEGVTNISDYTFCECSNLTSIEIPASVTNIGMVAINNCTSLTTINYAGTIAQWNAITFGASWNYNTPATEVICSDGSVSLS